MKKNRSTRKGFTLIELLVVITIIGILAGIAFVGFGDVFGTAGRTAAQKNLKTVYESLAAKTRNFPTSIDSQSDFVAWYAKKTKDVRPELWFLPDDEMVIELNDDDSVDPLLNIPTNGQEFGDWAEAIGYAVAVPDNEPRSRSFVSGLESGRFPILWTSGLSSDGWSDTSPWAGAGGHVLFSDGSVQWIDTDQVQNGDGIFRVAVEKGDETSDGNFETTSDIEEAIPGSWKKLDERE